MGRSKLLCRLLGYRDGPRNAWRVVILFIIIFIATIIYYNHKIGTLTEQVQKLQREKKASDKKMKRIREYNTVLDIRRNASAYTYSLPRNKMCFFRNKLAKGDMPTLHSIFSDPVSKSVVMVGVKLLHDTWHKNTFICKFENGDATVSDPIVNDFRSFGALAQYVVVITCSLPDQYILQTNFTMSLERVVPFPIKNDFSYDNFTVCSANVLPPKQTFLAACTMINDVDEFVPDWIDYHNFMGVEHFYLYDNQNGRDSTLPETVTTYIKQGIVTVIPWAHEPSKEKTYLEIQVAHENDCIWRHKHDTKWMIKIDVDEYIQPMDPTRPKISDYLADLDYEKLGSIRVQNWFFGRPQNSTVEASTYIERNRWRSSDPTEQNIGRDKNILQPKNVHYFKIHAIKLGGETRSANPRTDLRLVHYRLDNPRKRDFDLPKFDVKDESMVKIWKKIKQSRYNYEKSDESTRMYF
ncbi:uncharacterized protein LOC117111253 [Anneissia japonica]|uniref:uncharacterized protein LOC117111253 n=1 Tax=Anneissia japonica TaxID=1529436 RepID=UPI001425AA46|nr:uncharacterized protein LOC117111253 [Anneissia japonica]